MQGKKKTKTSNHLDTAIVANLLQKTLTIPNSFNILQHQNPKA